jgi:hypothetical protein
LLIYFWPADNRAEQFEDKSMPSPFPGMDPYLEAPGIWPDVHERLAHEISTHLNQELPAPYYAKLEVRLETGIIDEGEGRHRIVPDVAVVRTPRAGQPGGLQTRDVPRREPSPHHELFVFHEPIRHQFVEIRDGTRNHKLITLIEIVSPSNKRPGEDRQAYQRKQAEVLASDASLVELDLLRGGERLPPAPKAKEYVAEMRPPPDYLVTVSPAWLRGGEGLGHHLYPVGLRDPLPCIPVPLREGDKEVLLDLQYLFNRVYDGGPYRRGAVDYARPPQPTLTTRATTWARRLLRQQGLITAKPTGRRKPGKPPR